MLGRVTPATAAVTLALGSAPVLAGCDAADGGPNLVEAQRFEEGVASSSDGGAFRVVLHSTDGEGLGLGDNTLLVRLGFHDPADPLAPGRAIPGAELLLDAWMPYGDGAVEGLRGIYVGDGVYEITSLGLSEAGVWQLDFALSVGDGVDDSVSFAFVITD